MPTKQILGYGQQLTMACDGRCDKAWGHNGRPKTMLSEDLDDYVYLADDKLGTAPGPGETVGLSEGGHMKPSAVPLTDQDGAQMNKWCFRECERSDSFKQGEEVKLPDLMNPRPNIPRK